MKKALQVAAPLLLLVAMVIVYHIHPASQLPYEDISGHWAVEDIVRWSERGVMSGTAGAFRPDEGVKRAELATVLTRVLPLETVAENTFADVPADMWYEEAVLRCVAAGIIESEGRTELFPEELLTREEGFVMIARAFAIAPEEELRMLAGYNDAKRIAGEYKGTMEALLRLGLVSGGSEVQLYPKELLTRGEVTAALTKLQDGGYIP